MTTSESYNWKPVPPSRDTPPLCCLLSLPSPSATPPSFFLSFPSVCEIQFFHIQKVRETQDVYGRRKDLYVHIICLHGSVVLGLSLWNRAGTGWVILLLVVCEPAQGQLVCRKHFKSIH